MAATDKMAATAADRLVNAEANIEKATELLAAFEEVKSEEERKNLLTEAAKASSKLKGSLGPGADNEYVGAVTALKASMGVNFPAYGTIQAIARKLGRLSR